MNNTNRFANRFLLLVVGLITLALGVLAVGLATSTMLADMWDEIAPNVLAIIENWLQATPTWQTGPSWIIIGVLAALILAIIGLTVFIFRQGRGRTDRLIVTKNENDGITIIETPVAADLLRDALARQPEIITSHVSAYIVSRTPVLNVTVSCRRGASPRKVNDIINEYLDRLSTVIGTEIPALVQIRAGFRTQFATPQRLDSSTVEGADSPR